MAAALSARQTQTMGLLRKAEPDQDGYTGLMWTEVVYKVEDGTAWIYYRTALALEKKGLVSLDYRSGRIKPLEPNERGGAR